jgi:hypothetical protein
MMAWAVVITIAAFAVVIVVRHERRSRARMRADSNKNWWARRVQERDYFVQRGIEIWLSGIATMAPQNFRSKWEHAIAVHRYLLGGAPLSYGVEVAARRSRPTTTHDGVVHHVSLLKHDGSVVPVLMCNFDQQVDEAQVDDVRAYPTCMVCAIESREGYER